jgi:hypothetical protein
MPRGRNVAASCTSNPIVASTTAYLRHRQVLNQQPPFDSDKAHQLGVRMGELGTAEQAVVEQLLQTARSS